MSHKKIIKQKIDKYENPEIVNLKENDQEQTMEMHISAKGFKKKRETLTTAEMKKMLSDFKNEINGNMINLKTELKSDMVKMTTNLKTELKSNMVDMIANLRNELKSDINEVKSDINNLKNEMNNRFDKLEIRVMTLESFHEADFSKI